MYNQLPQFNINELISRNLQDRRIEQPSKQRVDTSQWHPQYELINFTIPQTVDMNTTTKKMKTTVYFRDNRNGQRYHKTVIFGLGDQPIFRPNDPYSRATNYVLSQLQKMKNLKNPLHSDYWRANLCFRQGTFIQNLLVLYKAVAALRWKEIQAPKDYTSVNRVKQKRRQTMMKRYGTQNPMKIKQMLNRQQGQKKNHMSIQKP